MKERSRRSVGIFAIGLIAVVVVAAAITVAMKALDRRTPSPSQAEVTQGGLLVLPGSTVISEEWSDERRYTSIGTNITEVISASLKRDLTLPPGTSVAQAAYSYYQELERLGWLPCGASPEEPPKASDRDPSRFDIQRCQRFGDRYHDVHVGIYASPQDSAPTIHSTYYIRADDDSGPRPRT